MADDEDQDLVVKLGEPEKIDPPADEEGGIKPKPAPVPGPTATPEPQPSQAALAELERQLESERAERTRVVEENRRLQAAHDNEARLRNDAEKRGVSTYELLVENQITALNEQMESLSEQVTTAMTEGDFKLVAELNKKGHKLGGKLAIAERDKEALAQQRERQPKPQPRQAALQPAQPAASADPKERALAAFSAPTRAFLRKHPDLLRSDGTLKGAAMRAHESALDASLPADTDAYFAHIEKLIGGGEPAGEEARTGSVPGYSAPVARGPAIGGDRLAPGEFRMTPKMRRLAEEQGIPPAEWAENYVRLVKEGRMEPIT